MKYKLENIVYKKNSGLATHWHGGCYTMGIAREAQEGQVMRLMRRKRPLKRYFRTTITMDTKSIDQWNDMVIDGHDDNLSAFIRLCIADAHERMMQEAKATPAR